MSPQLLDQSRFNISDNISKAANPLKAAARRSTSERVRASGEAGFRRGVRETEAAHAAVETALRNRIAELTVQLEVANQTIFTQNQTIFNQNQSIETLNRDIAASISDRASLQARLELAQQQAARGGAARSTPRQNPCLPNIPKRSPAP